MLPYSDTDMNLLHWDMMNHFEFMLFLNMSSTITQVYSPTFSGEQSANIFVIHCPYLVKTVYCPVSAGSCGLCTKPQGFTQR